MRLAACLIVVAGCAKSASKQPSESVAPSDRPVAGGTVAPTAPTPHPASTPPTAQPAPSPTGGGGADDERATKEAARNQGLLGPTDKNSFKPLDPKVGGWDTDKSAPRSNDPAKSAAPGGDKGGPVAAGVSLGAPVLSAKGDASAVVSALGKRQADFDKCYTTARASKAALAGKLSITFTIKPDGTIESAKVASSTVKDAALEKCVVGVVAGKLDKGPSDKAVAATLPITFAPPAVK